MKNDEDLSLFAQFFGNYPIVRVIDFLMEMRAYDYSKKEIAEYSGVALSTLNLFWKTLEQRGIVKVSRKIDKANLYTLNRESPLAKSLMEFSYRLALDAVPKIGKKRAVAA